MSDTSKCVGNRQECYGCGMCAAVCKTRVLSMKLNKLGFMVPRIVNQEACTNCGLCSVICNYGTTEFPAFSKPLASYAGWSNSHDVKKMCSSGGIAYELCIKFLSDGYKICAAKYNADSKKVEHYIIENESQLKDSVGSKYLQSHTQEAFANISPRERHVIIGTPCQIDMWRRYLRKIKKEDNFLLIDFFCHGVPSYNVWTKYLSENGLVDRMIKSVTWRDKSRGWHKSWNISAYKADRPEDYRLSYRSSSQDGDSFYFMFLSNCALNPACYSECKYKEFSSSADIRLGDLWGNLYKENEEGVSACVAFTPKGNDALQAINATLLKCGEEDVAEGQMKHHIAKPWYYCLVSKAIISPFISLKTIRKTFVISEIVHYQLSKLSKLISRK